MTSERLKSLLLPISSKSNKEVIFNQFDLDNECQSKIELNQHNSVDLDYNLKFIFIIIASIFLYYIHYVFIIITLVLFYHLLLFHCSYSIICSTDKNFKKKLKSRFGQIIRNYKLDINDTIFLFENTTMKIISDDKELIWGIRTTAIKSIKEKVANLKDKYKY